MTAAFTLCFRELKRFYRQRSRIVGSLGTPIIFWLLLGSGLEVAFPGQEDGFVKYFFPGNLILAILFTSIFSNISLIEDRHEGFLQAVRVAPLSNATLIFGKVAGGVAIASLQGILFLMLAPLAGISLSIGNLVMALTSIVVVSFTLSILGFVFAWRLDSVQGFHGVMNLILMPMWLLSGAFFPAEGAPLWLRSIMMMNPLTYGFSSLKIALFGTQSFSHYLAALVAHFAFGVAFYGLATVLLNRKEEFTQ